MRHLQDQPGSDRAAPRPGRQLIVTGSVLIGLALLLGITTAGFFAFAVWQFAGGDMLARGVVPGTVSVPIDEPGEYLIFYEHRSVVDGRSFHTSEQAPTLDFTLTSPGGDPITLEAYRFGYSYQTPSHEGQALFQFEAATAGTYELAAGDGGDQERYVVAVGKPRLGQFFAGIVGFFCGGGIAGVMLIVGLVLLIVGLVQRGRE